MIAIIIPYFKLAYFEATLRSLASQTDKRFKVYICDDASPENPLDLLKNFKGQFDYVNHRFESNLGSISLTEQWERCILLTQDEQWLMLLGDDDYLDESVVASWYKQYDTFNRKSNVIRFATKRVDEETQSISKAYTHPVWEVATDSFYRRFKGQTRSSLSEYIFSKKSFLKFKFSNYPLAWHSDDKAWIDFSNHKPIYTINRSTVFVRISNISITGKTDNNDLKNIASAQFLKDIIVQNLHLFTKQQRLEILYAYERAVQRNKLISFTEWFSICGLYLENFNSRIFIKFSIRFLKSTFRL